MDNLLRCLKQELKIDIDIEDEYLNRILDIGKNKLEELTGVSLLFKENSLEFDLLMTYGRYYYNNSEEYFENMNQKEILRLQLFTAVKARGERNEI